MDNKNTKTCKPQMMWSGDLDTRAALIQQKKTHKCPHEGCVAAFDRPYRLEQHILLHFNYRPFVCKEINCKKSYSSKSHLDRHINSVHLGIKKPADVYRCPTCFNFFSNNQNLKRHVKTHTTKMSLTCDICNKEFRNTNQLSTHKYQHTGIKPFICDLCDEAFMTHYEMKRHLRYHKVYCCDNCGKQFNHWNKLREHKTDEHQKKVGDYICNECGKLFKLRCDIVRHLKLHSYEPYHNKMYLCPYANCERVYTTNSNLKQHITVKHLQIFHKCTLCNAQLSSKSKLNYHLNLHERNSLGIKKIESSEPTVKLEPNLKEEAVQIIEIHIEPIDILGPASPDCSKTQ